MRPYGEIMCEMEPLLEEMCDDHEMQLHEVLGSVEAWVKFHRPDAIEELEDYDEV